MTHTTPAALRLQQTIDQALLAAEGGRHAEEIRHLCRSPADDGPGGRFGSPCPGRDTARGRYRRPDSSWRTTYRSPGRTRRAYWPGEIDCGRAVDGAGVDQPPRFGVAEPAPIMEQRLQCAPLLRLGAPRWSRSVQTCRFAGEVLRRSRSPEPLPRRSGRSDAARRSTAPCRPTSEGSSKPNVPTRQRLPASCWRPARRCRPNRCSRPSRD